MREVKTHEFVKHYFWNVENLLDAIKEYKRVTNIPQGEYSLADLLK